jgi:hypothetical protein
MNVINKANKSGFFRKKTTEKREDKMTKPDDHSVTRLKKGRFFNAVLSRKS